MDNYSRWIDSGLEDLEYWANQEGYWPTLLRRKWIDGVKNREEWEALRSGEGT